MRNYVFDITASTAELSERQEDIFEESVRLFMPANIVIDSWTSNGGEKRMWRVVGVIPGDTLSDMVNVLVEKVDRIRERIGIGADVPIATALAIRDVSVPIEEALPPMAIAAVNAVPGWHRHS